jgi:hypothetical protein
VEPRKKPQTICNVVFQDNYYSIIVSDPAKVIATFYTNPKTDATLKNISSVTFVGISGDPLWNSAKAVITIDQVGATYTVTCTLTDNSTMTFVGTYDTDNVQPVQPHYHPDHHNSDHHNSDHHNSDHHNSGSGSGSNSNYENYNHYNGSSYPSTFYGPNGGTAKINHVGGVYTVVLTDSNGKTIVYVSKKNSSDNNNGVNKITQSTYHGPNGTTAVVTSNGNGQFIVKVTKADGSVTIYYPTDGSSNNSSSGSSSSNGSSSSTSTDNFQPTQNPTPANWQNWADWFNSSSNQPQTSSQTQNKTDYSNYLPQGVPAAAIPSGSEDLYILKSEVVPPVCPVCPVAKCKSNDKKCPPCPACARCPDAPFECKKVPNYSSMNDDMMPNAILPAYSTFGM